MRKFLLKCWRWISLTDEPEPSENGTVDDPHDPQRVTRIVYDDDFIKLERPRR